MLNEYIVHGILPSTDGTKTHIVRRTQKNRVGRSLEWAEGAFTGEETASGELRSGGPEARRAGLRPGDAAALGATGSGRRARGRCPVPPRPKGLRGPGAARRADARDPAGPGRHRRELPHARRRPVHPWPQAPPPRPRRPASTRGACLRGGGVRVRHGPQR